jgi:hypothetical protein
MHNDDRPVLRLSGDDVNDVSRRQVRVGVPCDNVPLDCAQPVLPDGCQRLITIGVKRKTKQPRLLAGQVVHDVLSAQNLNAHLLRRYLGEVGMGPGVIAQLEQRIGGQRPGLSWMRLHPQASQEQGSRGIGPVEYPDDGFIVSRRLAGGLAGVEGEGNVGGRSIAMGDESGLNGR